jgi:hypothetical protein
LLYIELDYYQGFHTIKMSNKYVSQFFVVKDMRSILSCSRVFLQQRVPFLKDLYIMSFPTLTFDNWIVYSTTVKSFAPPTFFLSGKGKFFYILQPSMNLVPSSYLFSSSPTSQVMLETRLFYFPNLRCQLVNKPTILQ